MKGGERASSAHADIFTAVIAMHFFGILRSWFQFPCPGSCRGGPAGESPLSGQRTGKVTGHSHSLDRNASAETALAPPSDESITHIGPPNNSLAVDSSSQFTKGFASLLEKQNVPVQDGNLVWPPLSVLISNGRDAPWLVCHSVHSTGTNISHVLLTRLDSRP